MFNETFLNESCASVSFSEDWEKLVRWMMDGNGCDELCNHTVV